MEASAKFAPKLVVFARRALIRRAEKHLPPCEAPWPPTLFETGEPERDRRCPLHQRARRRVIAAVRAQDWSSETVVRGDEVEDEVTIVRETGLITRGSPFWRKAHGAELVAVASEDGLDRTTRRLREGSFVPGGAERALPAFGLLALVVQHRGECEQVYVVFTASPMRCPIPRLRMTLCECLMLVESLLSSGPIDRRSRNRTAAWDSSRRQATRRPHHPGSCAIRTCPRRASLHVWPELRCRRPRTLGTEVVSSR